MKLPCGLRDWLVDHAPIPFLTHAHEVFIAGALFVIGGGLVVGDVNPASVSDQVRPAIATVWAVFLFAGSAATIWGLFQDHPRLEWAGQMILGYGCAFYALALLGLPIRQTGVSLAVFVGLAAVSWWRAFKITSAAKITRRLNREAHAASVRVTEKRRSNHDAGGW